MISYDETNPPPLPNTMSEYEYDVLVDLGVIQPVTSEDSESDEEPEDWELEYIQYLEDLEYEKTGC